MAYGDRLPKLNYTSKFYQDNFENEVVKVRRLYLKAKY